MSSSISRESFQEAKNYLGVHFQQGRPILDADLNEAQAVLRSTIRRFARDSAGDGSPNQGFAIEQLLPPLRRPNPLDDSRRKLRSPEDYTSDPLDYGMQYLFDRAAFFLTVPGDDLLDGFGSGEFTASQGRVRVSRDRPYRGDSFLRVSGHTGPVTVSRRLKSLQNLSEFDVATFRYRLNRPAAGIIRFFLEDDDGNRTSWPCQTPLTFPADTWLAGVATLLDPRFHIHTSELSLAQVDAQYIEYIYAHGATRPVTWTFSGPPGLAVTNLGGDELWAIAVISFTPTVAGTFPIEATAVDGDGRSTTRSLSLTVLENDGGGFAGSDAYHRAGQYWKNAVGVKTTETAADITAIRRYGFELYQADEPLVWDLDDLRLGGADLQARRGENNFVIRGSEIAKHVRRAALVSTMRDEDGGYQGFVLPGHVFQLFHDDGPAVLQERLDSELVVADRAADGAGRFHLAGLPCVQADDILYSDQADPNDEPLAPPDEGQTRRDEVYLDAWTEPVTYVQDPTIREVALGGPDTSAREQVRHRVRVAQGGRTPTGDGMGSGTLATEGAYTAAANRLYRVEIDGPGDIGAATFRWSHENASVIARVIEPVPPGSTVVVVEDASAFHPGDLLLLRKESGAERHEVSQVTGNEITLAAPTGDQLGQLPGAATPEFTTFALADRPMVQRWDGFGVAVTADPDDETVSASIPLDDGVRVRFGGHGMRSGDFWTFTTRHLPGHEPAGTDAGPRVERLDFARPQGVRHHYAPLAAFTRHGGAPDQARITDIEDLRATLGGSTRAFDLPPVVITRTNTNTVHLGGVRLPTSSHRSKHLVILSGSLGGGGGGTVVITSSFYTDEMTDPQTDPATGRIGNRTHAFSDETLITPVVLTRLTSGPSFLDEGLLNAQGALPPTPTPTSVQFFVQYLQASGELRRVNLTATVLELS